MVEGDWLDMEPSQVKWPDLLIGTHKKLLLMRDRKLYPLAEEDGPFYGITWDYDQIYVGVRYGGGGMVHMFSPQGKDLGILPGAYNEIHQIFHTGQRLYITSTGIDEVAIWENGDCTIRNWTGKDGDTIHVNSIWVDPQHLDKVYLICHNLTSYTKNLSAIIVMDPDLTMVKKKWRIGGDVHNVWVNDDLIYICDSHNTRLLEYTIAGAGAISREIPLQRWTRGLAATDKYMVVGESMVGMGLAREQGSFTLNLIDREQWKVVDTIEVDGLGAVFEVRVINERDYAHNGIACPLDWKNYDGPLLQT